MAAVVEGWLPAAVSAFHQLLAAGPRAGGGADRPGRRIDVFCGGKPTRRADHRLSSFPKQGDRSVGVARQWTGRLGKVDNSSGRVIRGADRWRAYTPIDARLYLPERWIEDPALLQGGRIPEATQREDVEERTRASTSSRQGACLGIRFCVEWASTAVMRKERDFFEAIGR